MTGLAYDPDAYLGLGQAVRTDRYGRRWVPEAVDYAAAEARVAAYDADVEAMFEASEPGVEPNPGIETNLDEGTVHTGVSQSWTSIQCSEGTVFTDPSSDGFLKLNERQRKIVFIYIDRGSLGTDLCSGTMVDSDSLLTAAHLTPTVGTCTERQEISKAHHQGG